MRILFSLFCRLMAVALLFGGLVFPAFAESESGRSAPRSQKRVKNVPAAYSCYTHLTMMLRGSSFSVSDKLRPSLQLNIDRDDGDHVLATVQRGRDNAQIGWIVYHPATQSLLDVSQIIENEDKEAALAGENGKSLKIDRRFAYLFNQCRQRHDVTQAASCRQRQSTSNVDGTRLSLRAQGQVARLDKGRGEKITLYSAPDAACSLDSKLVLKTGTALKVYHETDDFYFVRQDGVRQDFITGWILKDHVQNIKFVTPPASEQIQNVTLVPSAKPVATQKDSPPPSRQRRDSPPPPRQAGRPKKTETVQKVIEPVQSQALDPEFDVQEIQQPQQTQEAEIIPVTVVEEEQRIPVPPLAKPLPPDMEPAPKRRPRSTLRNRDSRRRDG